MALVLAAPLLHPDGLGSARAVAAVPAGPVDVELGAGPVAQALVVGAPVVGIAAPRIVEPPVGPVPEPESGRAPAAVAAAEGAAGGTTDLAVAVLDRATGEVAVGMGGAAPFYSASLSKVLLAVDVLDRRRLDGLAVSAADLDLIRRALGPSDDSAMSALWSRFDGALAPGRLSARLGLSGTGGPHDASQWGETKVSAVDTVRIWQHILDGMPAADRDLLLSAMQAAPARARDGFDQAYGLLSMAVDGVDGPGAVAKQGWMCCFSGDYYLNSAGAVGADERFLVALLTRQPRGSGWDAARQELNGIALAAVEELT